MMHEIHTIFNHILHGMEQGLDRYRAVDHEHFEDKLTGLKFHLYDNKPFEITHNGELVATQADFTDHEVQMLGKMKRYLVQSVSNNHRNYLSRLFDVNQHSDNMNYEHSHQHMTENSDGRQDQTTSPT